MLGLNSLHPSISMPYTLLSSSLKEHCIMSLLYKPLSSTYVSVFTDSKTMFAILCQIGFESSDGLRKEPEIIFCQKNTIYVSKVSSSMASNNTVLATKKSCKLILHIVRIEQCFIGTKTVVFEALHF